ncbi:MAG: dihydrolipoyl dehydrogenase [Nitrososphaerota archaeon]|nr:dihydrolipoyl dehydrogenase [Aigarchaeota archaeon]MDW8076440.1 dihydrolipoyl dehydrogenase [Nitrososphaerota archaeon]
MEADAVVIGGGPAGYVAAIRLGQLRKKTVLVEKDNLGGTCLNYGCIPSKVLITAADIFWKVGKLDKLGIKVQGLSMELKQLQDWKREVIAKLRDGIAYLLKGNGVKIIKGFATLRSPKEVEVREGTSGTIIKTNSVLWTVGAEDAGLPNIPYDGKRILSAKDLLDLEIVPKSMLIVGGGAIGLELGTALAKMGTKVIIVEIMDQLLPGISKDAVTVVHRNLKRLGVEVYTSSRVLTYRYGGGHVSVDITKNGETLSINTEYVLVTVGRRASSQNYGLKELGVELDKNGFVVVDSSMRTSLENIFAAGDAVGPPFLAHKASRQGLIAAETIAGQKTRLMLPPVPLALFTDPEIAVVGMSEEEAKASGIDVAVGKFPFTALSRANISNDTEGFVKVVVDRSSEKILGVQIVGRGATDLIGEAALAISAGMRVDELDNAIHPHPTFSEAIGEAAGAVNKKAIHLLNV